jgi:hypothetical protein
MLNGDIGGRLRRMMMGENFHKYRIPWLCGREDSADGDRSEATGISYCVANGREAEADDDGREFIRISYCLAIWQGGFGGW